MFVLRRERIATTHETEGLETIMLPWSSLRILNIWLLCEVLTEFDKLFGTFQFGDEMFTRNEIHKMQVEYCSIKKKLFSREQ